MKVCEDCGGFQATNPNGELIAGRICECGQQHRALLAAKDKSLQDATEAFNEASRHSVEVIAAITKERDELKFGWESDQMERDYLVDTGIRGRVESAPWTMHPPRTIVVHHRI